MIKKTLALLFLFLTIGTLVTQGTASAASYGGYYGSNITDDHYWCNVLGTVQAGFTQGQCSKGGVSRQDDALVWLTGCNNDSTCLKTNTINYIRDRLNGGDDSELQHVGASYIVNTMRGENLGRSIYPYGANSAAFNDWVNRVSLGNVTAKIISYSFTINTAYDPRTNDIVAYSEDASTADVLMFYVDNVPRYAIKLDCGNPVGNFSALPAPGWSLTGDSGVDKTSVYPGETLRFDNRVTNSGPSAASFTYGNRKQYDGNAVIDLGSKSASNIAKDGFVGDADVFVVPANGAAKVCEWVTFDPYNSGTGRNGVSTAKCATINQPQPQCSGITYNPGTIEPTQKFDATFRINYADGAPGLASAMNTGGKMFLVITNASTGAVVYSGYPASTSSGSVWTATADDIGPAGAGAVYNVTYGVQTGAGAINCPTTKTIAYNPYFNIEGGDIAAGAGFGNCTPDTTAGISGWNNDSQPFYGAGAQLAALAMGQINHFATAVDAGSGSSVGSLNNVPLATGQAYNLTFANTPTQGSYGGVKCMPDYFTQAMAKNPQKRLLLTPDQPDSGVYQSLTSPLNVALLTGGQIGKGKNITFVVDGDAYIGGDITYENASKSSEIPRFTLIVKGNINIGPGVKELHGVYIAQKSGSTGGVIKTCANATGVGLIDYNVCKNKLNFVGAVAADKIELRRTYGSLNGGGTTTTTTVNGLDPANWNYNGDAANIGGNAFLTRSGRQLTQGNIISKDVYNTNNLTINFNMQMFGGGGADGIGLGFLLPSANQNATGQNGCGLGYGDIGAINGITFDTWKNANDISNNFLGMPYPMPFDAKNCAFAAYQDQQNLVGKVNLRPNPVAVRVVITNGSNMTVFLNNVQYMSQPVSLPTEVRIALTAGNGQVEDNHVIRSFSATATSGPASTTNNAAETFLYSPELWMANGSSTYGGSTGGLEYDAITSLAPTL